MHKFCACFFKKVQISIWEHRKSRGGGLNFSKMSEFQLFDSVVCNITFIRNVWNSKMSQFGQRGGVKIFQKCLKFKNVPKVGGGGGQPYLMGTLSQIFLIFYFDASPKEKCCRTLNQQKTENPPCHNLWFLSGACLNRYW